MRGLLMTAAVLVILAGCDGSGGVNSGPLELGIVAGNYQTAEAGSERLSDPVVGQLVRAPDGGLTFRFVTPAYAQGTVVSGSPVPGAVVCAVSLDEGGMEPWTPCTNTDDDGQATFFFTPGTRADTVRSEIRGTVEGEPAVFDTAVAIVEPGALVAWKGGSETLTYAAGDSIDFRDLDLWGRDEYHNVWPSSAVAAKSIEWVWMDLRDLFPDTPPADAGSGWTSIVPAEADSWESPGVVGWIDGIRGAISIKMAQ